jgi:adenylate kinase
MEMINQFHPENELLILDGLPRNVKQAKLLDETIDVVKVINLVCTDMAKMIERLRRRALKENRVDDANDKVIQNRLEVYERNTKPVLEYYASDKIARIDATLSQIKVLNSILDVIVPIKDEIDYARDHRPKQPELPPFD